MGRVTGKVALISGGAMGIGKATAELLAREGAHIVVSDIVVDQGQQVAEGIISAGGSAEFQKLDVAQEADWETVIDGVMKSRGRLDITVNNAGVEFGGTAEDTTLEQWRWLMSVNLDGVFLGTKHSIKAMKSGGGGSIINISSIEGIIGDALFAAYNASKGGVRIFSKSAALHCAEQRYNIRVNSVHPGCIWTPMVEKFITSQGQDLAEGKSSLESSHPIGRVGEPEDVAYGVLYLASDESKFVTGSELVIDGGYTAK